jgi:Stage II sporulation protein E (SpoIIE)
MCECSASSRVTGVDAFDKFEPSGIAQVGAVRTLVDVTTDPAEILAGLNRRLNGRLNNGFAACLVLRFDSEGGCVLANAGHLAPFLDQD